MLITELEERERAFKKSRLEQEKQRAAREGENDRIKEAGRWMREERERRQEELVRHEETRAEAEREGPNEDAPPSLGPYDTTIRVKFALSAFPSLGTASALASHLKRFGEIDEGTVVLSTKPKKAGKKKNANEGEGEKVVNAVVPFTQIGAAFAVVSSAAALKEQGMEVSWVGGSEPPILNWLRDRGELGGKRKGGIPVATPLNGNQPKEGGEPVQFSTFVSFFLLQGCYVHVFPSSSLVRSPLRLHPLSPPNHPTPWILNP